MLTALLLAGTQYVSYTIPAAERPASVSTYAAGWQEPAIAITVPPFDTTLGTLTDVELYVNYTPTWEWRVEHLTDLQGTDPISWRRAFQLNVVYRPSFVGPVEHDLRNRFGVSAPAGQIGTGNRPFPIGPFDGLLDYQGPSGFGTSYAHSGLYTQIVNLHTGSDALELWYWSLPSPRTVYLCPRRLQASEFTIGIPGHWVDGDQISLNFNASVQIMYHYQ